VCKRLCECFQYSELHSAFWSYRSVSRLTSQLCRTCYEFVL